MKCKICGTENADTATYCTSCGSVLSSICPTCGANITNTNCFCPSCGRVVHIEKRKTIKIESQPTPEIEEVEDYENNEDEEKRRKRFSIIFKIVFGICFGIPSLLIAIWCIITAIQAA